MAQLSAPAAAARRPGDPLDPRRRQRPDRRARPGARLHPRRAGAPQRAPPVRRRRADDHRRRAPGPRPAAFLGADEVELFPAWETLPFERVSPGVETMGRRLRTMWRLRDPRARRPAVVVAAGPRAACSGSGPHVEDVEPDRRRARATQLDRDELVARLVARRLPARVPGRAPRRGRRARLDRRRVPVDRRRARSASTCGATRSTG